MHLQIITIYCACDDLLREMNVAEDRQAAMTTAEVMTVALVAARFFHGNVESARRFLRDHNYMSRMLCRSRLNRRLHRIPPSLWTEALAKMSGSGGGVFIVDSCPVPVCRYARAKRCRLYSDPAYFGYCAAKDEHFYGLKAHAVVTAEGRPVEVQLLPGCGHDLVGLEEMALDLPAGSTLYGDKGYTSKRREDALRESKGIRLLPLRRRNSRNPHPKELAARISRVRKRIETTFSAVTESLGRHVRAVTAAGFEMKVMAAFVAYAILG